MQNPLKKKSDKQTCPRRVGEFGPWERAEGLDTWTMRGKYRHCNFCGSMHPDDFMKLVEDGYAIGPTDKSYKAYVHDAGDHPEGGSYVGKFYFQHLTIDQRVEFVEKLNAKTINISYPGHFYVRPFFVVPVE